MLKHFCCGGKKKEATQTMRPTNDENILDYTLLSNVNSVTIRICHSPFHQKRFHDRKEITLSELLLLCSLNNRVGSFRIHTYMKSNKQIVLDLIGTSSTNTGYHIYSMKMVHDIAQVKIRMSTTTITKVNKFLSSNAVDAVGLLYMCTKLIDSRLCHMKLISYTEDAKELYMKVS